MVRQALEVLTPAMPLRMEDGNTMLTYWTKKILVEEGYSMQQSFHILQLIVRHHKVYYPVRHYLIQQMIAAMHRLGFSANATIDYRRLSVELAEVIIKWEIQRVRDTQTNALEAASMDDETLQLSGGAAVKRNLSQDEDNRKKMGTGENSPQSSQTAQTSTQSQAQGSSTVQGGITIDNPGKPIERQHCDTVLNFLFRLSCQFNDGTSPGIISPNESLSRRCVLLLKQAMKPDIWAQHQCDLKLSWLDKVFGTIETQAPNIGNICTALELLTFLLTVMKKEQILNTFRPLQRGLSLCVTCPNTNTKVIKLMHGLLTRLMAIFPTDSHHKCDDFETLYATISKMIYEGLGQYEKNPQANPSSLFGTLMILKAACTNNQSYIDRLIMPFMRLLNRLTKEHLGGNIPGAASAQSGAVSGNATAGGGSTTSNQDSNTMSGPVALELLILSLDLVKNRIVVMGVEMRKMFIGNILVGLIEKSNDVKVRKFFFYVLFSLSIT